MSDRVRTLLSDHGIRCTRQRTVIYEALTATRTHPTAEELHDAVAAACPTISLATVYNTLEALCRAGLCRKLHAGKGGARYDAHPREHLHILTEDGRVVDVDPDLSRELLESVPQRVLEKIERSTGHRLDRRQLHLVGAGSGV